MWISSKLVLFVLVWPCLLVGILFFWFLCMEEGEHWHTGKPVSEGATVSVVILETRDEVIDKL